MEALATGAPAAAAPADGVAPGEGVAPASGAPGEEVAPAGGVAPGGGGGGAVPTPNRFGDAVGEDGSASGAA
jgi:hypothetical protein